MFDLLGSWDGFLVVLFVFVFYGVGKCDVWFVVGMWCQ